MLLPVRNCQYLWMVHRQRQRQMVMGEAAYCRRGDL